MIDSEGLRCVSVCVLWVVQGRQPWHNGFITLHYLPGCQQGITATEVESKINYADVQCSD